MRLADDSYNWYRDHAMRSRRNYRIVEIALLVVGAAIPTSAAVVSDDATIPAILGGAVVVLTGFRPLFHWQDNYLRFSAAREAVEAERRRYNTGTPPYQDARTRDQRLAEAVTTIEQQEMGGWLKIAGERPKP
jgi:hypothetical protein